MSGYTEFYVVPIKKHRLDDYRSFAEKTGKLWRAHGALSVAEFIADDAKAGVQTSFPQAVHLEPDEIVGVAMIEFASREDCARIKDAFVRDPVFANMDPIDVPVDGKRMFWGGFTTLLTC